MDAAFWYEFSGIGWNHIARTVSGRVKQDLWALARTFALLNRAMADSYIAGWDSKKYPYNLWRPMTAIHLACAAFEASPRPRSRTPIRA